jgi:prepilin peptidase CpaA
MPVSVYLDVCLAVLVSLAAANDLATRRIPNLLLLAGVSGAVLLHSLSPSPLAALLWSLAGAATGLLVFLPLYCLRGMAAGDVKLMAAVGAFSAPMETLSIAVVAVCVGGVLSLAVVVAKGRLRALGANLSALMLPLLMRLVRMPAAAAPLPGPSVGSIPYGVAIAGGAWFVIAQRYHWPASLASLL